MEKSSEWLWVVAAALMGAAFCYLWAGPVVLSPTSVEWLNTGDRAMHTLGWWYFREAPWGWPPGASPKLGLELASGVALSDSLPLFAFPFKLLSGLLPPTFQYWGIWYLLCFMLQGSFGYLIARELTLGRGIALAAALFCILQPAFLDRLPRHMALGGHWTVLAALYLYVRREPPPRFAWPLLLGIVAAVHAYLMALCGAIWIAALVQRLGMRRMRPSDAAVEAAFGVAAMLAVMWAGGIFMVRSYGSGGYGTYQLNLLTLLDPSGWSHIFPDLPETNGDYEGRAFMGAGVLLLIVATVIAVMFGRARRLDWSKLWGPRWLPIVVIGAGLTLFAVSNRIAAGSVELPAVPLPAWALDLVAVFRASGRMFWPVGYLLLFAVLLAASRALGRWALWVTLPLVLLQGIDSSGAWTRLRTVAAPGSEWSTPLKDPAWDLLAERYERIRGVPVSWRFKDWKSLSYLALRHHIGLDAAYLARVDDGAQEALRAAGNRALTKGEFDPGAIYVMARGPALLAQQQAQPGDLMSELDGVYVFARGGADRLRKAGLQVPERLPEAPPLAVNMPLATDEANKAVAGDYMPIGWASPFGAGTWTEGMEATLVFGLEPVASPVLHLIASGRRQGDGKPQHVTVLVNGQPAGRYELSPRRPADVAIPLPAGLAGTVTVTFQLSDPSRPSDSNPFSNDTRLLGMELRSIELRSE